MRFKNGPQLPGAGRTRVGHHHRSHTPTSPEAVLLGKMAHHTKQIRRQCSNQIRFIGSYIPIYQRISYSITRKNVQKQEKDVQKQERTFKNSKGCWKTGRGHSKTGKDTLRQ